MGLRLLTDDGARVAIVALMMMAVCSSLLGVVMGWYLRGREIDRLWRQVRYYRRLMEGRAREKECEAVHPSGKLICSRPKGHYARGTSPHGYAGVFWEETNGKAG